MTEAQLVERHTPLVVSQVFLFIPTGINDFDDLMQVGFIGLVKAIRHFDEGFIGLVKAIRHFDEERGNQFSTFATTLIRREILRELGRNTQVADCNLAIDIPDRMPENLWELMPEYLSSTEKEVLKYRLREHTMEEIGDKLGCSKQWANVQLRNAFKKIREANNVA
jgi:RNA polymerase sigma factor (sigma-70 family)